MAKKRVEGPTPAGGAYSIGHFLTLEHGEANEEDAELIIIGEYDENDELIKETICYTEKGRKHMKKNGK